MQSMLRSRPALLRCGRRQTRDQPAWRSMQRPRHQAVRCLSSRRVAWLHEVATNSPHANGVPLEQKRFDAIVMLAGGLHADGGLPEWVSRRLDTCHDLHLLQPEGHRAPVLSLGGGTPHKPAILGPTGHVLHESTACAEYLMAKGLEADNILKECASFDTVGNAYFSLTIHAVPAGWRRLAVVTSDFHMPRSAALFTDVYEMAGRQLFQDPRWFDLTFVSSSDEGVFEDYVLQARREKEADSLARWRADKEAAGLTSLVAFHAWFFSDHACYSVQKQRAFGKRTIQDERLLASY